MAQEQQQERLRKLRAARQNGNSRIESFESRQPVTPGTWTAYPPAKSSRGHGGALVALLLILLVAGGVLGGIGYVFSQFHSAVGGPHREVRFVVSPGETVNSIASALGSDGLVSNGFLFQLYYRLNGGASSIQEGPHLLNTDMSMQQIADALQQPPLRTVAVVDTSEDYNFLPGHRAEELAQALAKGGAVSYDAFMYQVRHGTFNYWFLKGRPAGATLEGFLYPGRYHLARHYDAHKLVNQMLANFDSHFTPAMHAEAARRHRSVYEVVTIASIVQRESSVPVVQRYIASVYYNRLNNVAVVSQQLNADPTVQYALGYRPQEKTWWEKHLDQTMIAATDSPYNTYKNPGLPPGPISNPGSSAIAAALQPAPSQYLFFEALGKNNKTHFCVTLDCQTNGAGVTVN